MFHSLLVLYGRVLALSSLYSFLLALAYEIADVADYDESDHCQVGSGQGPERLACLPSARYR